MPTLRILCSLMIGFFWNDASAQWKPGSYLAVENDHENVTYSELTKDLQTADADITCQGDTVDIGVGRIERKTGARIPQLFTLEDLEYHFARRNRTGFVRVSVPWES